MKRAVYAGLLVSGFLLLICCGKKSGSTYTEPPPAVDTSFTNPLLNGADPWVIRHDGFYYYTHTLGNKIALWKTAKMSELGKVVYTPVFAPAPGLPNSSNIWAPELHYLDNKWYLYYTAGSGPDNTQRTWVLENSNADPTRGVWTDKGRLFTADSDFWAIDGTVLEYQGNRYFVWSGRPDGSVQDQYLYIAKMSNPWTLEAPATQISSPSLSWERNGGPVNEGPEILQNAAGRVFLVYSASGCWTDDYALGMLTLKDGGDPLQPGDWTKNPQPVFVKNPANHAFAPGHCSFFKSPDGTQDWILYHANSNSGDGCSIKRNVRMQSFSWNSDGSPHFGSPVATGEPLHKPSGE